MVFTRLLPFLLLLTFSSLALSQDGKTQSVPETSTACNSSMSSSSLAASFSTHILQQSSRTSPALYTRQNSPQRFQPFC